MTKIIASPLIGSNKVVNGATNNNLIEEIASPYIGLNNIKGATNKILIEEVSDGMSAEGSNKLNVSQNIKEVISSGTPAIAGFGKPSERNTKTKTYNKVKNISS